jgi:hypothetical protein
MAALLILPLIISGYIFYHSSLLHKGSIEKRHGQYTYLKILVWGTPFIIVSLLLFFQIDTSHKFTIPLGGTTIPVYKLIDNLTSGFENITKNTQNKNSSTYLASIVFISVLSFFLSWLAAFICNIFLLLRHGKDTKYQISLKRIDDPSIRMLYVAAKENKLVSFTLDSRKVYVGYVIEIDTPDSDSPHTGKHVSVFPLLSGFRNPTGLDIVFNTIYDPDEFKVLEEDLRIYLNMDNVITSSYFDLNVYNHTKK